MSFEEIWISYLVGASLWVAPKMLTTDPEGLPDALVREGVTVLHAVPTLLALFAHDVPGLRIVNLGGEVCPDFLVPRWATPGRRLFNTYGPTETTVSASLAELLPGQPVTIGTPLPNYGMLIRGDDGAVLPQGQVGELCITGPGVAGGYLGRPELTAEKFLANPRPSGDHDTRMYRSGDLARIDPLTQALNRRGLEELLQRELARAARNNSPLGVAVIDLDDFHQTNDAHGHAGGDALLQHLVAVCKLLLRATDGIARLGGDEFVLVLPETQGADSMATVQRLQRSLAHRVLTVQDRRVPVHFSAGLAQWQPGDDAEALLRRADDALYAAKRQGKNRVQAG
ncbi:hypothetical protein G6F57_013701 [Rhizopus arrhizus]|nr:hypothetical protein G6F57_013701 [Rhizopus arrhizus]